MKEYTLKGGTRDGEKILCELWQTVAYKPMRLTIAQIEALTIKNGDEGTPKAIAYRRPDEVYIRNENNEFVFDHIVHYDPRHAYLPIITPEIVEIIGTDPVVLIEKDDTAKSGYNWAQDAVDFCSLIPVNGDDQKRMDDWTKDLAL